jgi:hypothetical protein
MSGICWLAGDPRHGRLPLVAAQFAQLFGMECRRWNRTELRGPAAAPPSRMIVAMSYRTLRSLRAEHAARLRNTVRAGAIVYIRGGFERRECSLSPLMEAGFSYHCGQPADEYRIESEPITPQTLRDERVAASLSLPAATEISANATPLLSARFAERGSAPFALALKCGKGWIICDLLPDAPAGSSDIPLFDRLADAHKRHCELSALIAVRLAAGLDPERKPPVNLIMDDRPANFDLLNTGNLRKFLEHVDAKYPGVHVDFAWTPDQLHPSRAYIETLKRFNTGFVWHGFKRHINHRRAFNLDEDLRDGTRMVERISRRFGVRLQPVMVFPFEAFGLDALPVLEKGGFLATFASPLAPVGLWSPYPSFMDYSAPLHEQFIDIFPVMRRYSRESLTRDTMLAHVALDLPIVMVIHPDEIGLRRWPYKPLPQGTRTHCDALLSFAAEKRLPSRSLEEIARELLTRPRPTVADFTEMCRGELREIR